jgi:hypothetical protein
MIGRFDQSRSFGPSLDWERRPAIGGVDRREHLRRIRAIRRVALALFCFWAGVVFAIVWFH